MSEALQRGGTDVRLRMFAALFFVGIVAHELEFGLEQEQVSHLSNYLEHWRRAVPTVAWSSSVGLTAHIANLVFSGAAAIASRPRRWLSALLLSFVLSQIASPDRTSSHSSVVAGALLAICCISVIEGLFRLG